MGRLSLERRRGIGRLITIDHFSLPELRMGYEILLDPANILARPPGTEERISHLEPVVNLFSKSPPKLQ